MNIVKIYIDDSGILHKNDKYCIYGGFFLINGELVNKSILKNKVNEIKYNKLKSIQKKVLLKNLLDYNTFGIVIKNCFLDSSVITKSKSRGRFRDYAYRRITKEIMYYIFRNKLLSDTESIKIVINIDENSLVSNVNRSLTFDIYNELKFGVYNKKYNLYFNKVINSKLYVEINYIKSHEDTCIQYADVIAGYIRENMYKNNFKIKKINILKYLP